MGRVDRRDSEEFRFDEQWTFVRRGLHSESAHRPDGASSVARDAPPEGRFCRGGLDVARIGVVGGGPLAAGLVGRLRTYGARAEPVEIPPPAADGEAASTPGDIVVCAMEHATYADLHAVGEAALAAGRPCVFVAVEAEEICVGPALSPGRSAGFLRSRLALITRLGEGPLPPREILTARLPEFRVGGREHVESWVADCAGQMLARELARLLTEPEGRTCDTVLVSVRDGPRVRHSLPLATGRPSGAARERDPAQHRMALVLGSQRSGTTVLARHLGERAGADVLDEDESYPRLSRVLPAPARPAVYKVPAWTSHVDFLAEHYPGAHYVFLTRPIEQVTASMLSLANFAGTNWAEVHADAEIRSSLLALPDPVAAEALRKEHARCVEPSTRAAMCAFLKASSAGFLRRAGLGVHVVDYRELVSSPGPVISTLLCDLGWKEGAGGRSPEVRRGKGIGQTDHGRAIDESSLLRYRQVLSEEQVAKIRSLEARWRSFLPSPGDAT